MRTQTDQNNSASSVYFVANSNGSYLLALNSEAKPIDQLSSVPN